MNENFRMAIALLLGVYNTWTRAVAGSWVAAIWAGVAMTVVGLWVVYRERNDEVRRNSLDWLLTTQVIIGFVG